MPSGSGNGDMGADGEAGADCFRSADGETEARSCLGGGRSARRVLRHGKQQNSSLPKPWPSFPLGQVSPCRLREVLAYSWDFGELFPGCFSCILEQRSPFPRCADLSPICPAPE